VSKEKIRSLYLQNVMYKTLAWAFILWIPASKLANCSPTNEIKYALGSIFMDFYAAISLTLALVVFFLGKKARKEAERLESKDSQ
jgi:hypothetical protein